MKKIYSKFLLFALGILAVGCNNDDEMSHTKVSAVEALYFPADNTFLNLGAQSSALFEWEAAKAQDNGVVLYDVVFDVEGGDFSDPVFVVPSDGNGYKNQLNITFAELNRIAGLAGIQPETTGKLIWTVFSSKGINVMKSAVYRTIEVERPAGFPVPDELFITGTASEGGATLADAVPFKKISAAKFEIYTRLQPGDYQLVTRNQGTPLQYYIDGNSLKADGTTTYSGDTKVYRIVVDFSSGQVTMTEIVSVEIWFPPTGSYLFAYDYAGKGKWEALNKFIEFNQQSWGRDERYKFRFTVKNGDTTSEEWFGSVNADNNRPDANTGAAYWYMVPVTNDYWNNCFKFAAINDMATVNGLIDFSATAPAYTHSFTNI